MNNGVITGSGDGGLSLPSEHIPPSWLEEEAMNLGVNLYPQEQQDTFSFPSPPPTCPFGDMIHYYVDILTSNGDGNSQFTQDTQEIMQKAESVVNSQVNEVNESQSVPRRKKFLKLSVHIIHERTDANNGIRLSRQSQLLTTDDYMSLLKKQEERKKEIEDLKLRSKQQTEERKAARILKLEVKEQQKVEREIKRKEQEQLRILQKKEKVQKKEQLRLQKEQERKEREIEVAHRALQRERRLSNPLNPLPEGHPLMRDFLNINMPAFSTAFNSSPINPSHIAYSPILSQPSQVTCTQLPNSVANHVTTTPFPTPNQDENTDPGTSPPFPSWMK